MVQAVIKNDNGFFLIISMRMTFEREIYANWYVEGFDLELFEKLPTVFL